MCENDEKNISRRSSATEFTATAATRQADAMERIADALEQIIDLALREQEAARD